MRELFRYEKRGRLRVYMIRWFGGTGELWIAAGTPGNLKLPTRRLTVSNPDDEDALAADLEQTLRACGWSRIA